MTELYLVLGFVFSVGVFVGVTLAFFWTGTIIVKKKNRRNAGLDVNRILSGQTKDPFDKP